MSVLKLRRDMVVVDHEDAAGPAAADSERPFPLRKLDPEPADQSEEIIEGQIAEEADEGDAEEALPLHRTLGERIKFWANAVAIFALVAAYPTMVVASSDVGDRDFDQLMNRADWSAPWVGGAATLMESHFVDLGWAPDAEAWEPMARLTAKPAYQSAMAQALGDMIGLATTQAAGGGQPDVDLAAASRLVRDDSTATELRAARDALVNYDRRLRRRDVASGFTAAQIAEQLAMISTWADSSQTDIVKSATSIGGSPMDEEATRAVYAAKGRATVAWLVLSSMQWPESAEAAKARNVALKAWREIAEFHPLIVFNGDADGSLFGNHAASMGFLIAQAEAATATFDGLVKAAAAGSSSPGAAPGPAVGAGR